MSPEQRRPNKNDNEYLLKDTNKKIRQALDSLKWVNAES